MISRTSFAPRHYHRHPQQIQLGGLALRLGAWLPGRTRPHCPAAACYSAPFTRCYTACRRCNTACHRCYTACHCCYTACRSALRMRPAAAGRLPAPGSRRWHLPC